ncbi:hypothetical protein L7B14_004209 [Salmonella enterica]|nr:hypothetical protein [Salmonella enterica]
MSFLDSAEYEAGNAVEKDVVGGGFKSLPSGIYGFDVLLAYCGKSKGGAKFVQLELKEVDTDNKRRFTIYVSNKEGSIKYKNKKTGALEYLPGFLTIDSLCLLTVGKPLVQLQAQIEKKTINLYNFDLKREVPTEVDMLMPLIGQRIKAGILETIENKSAKNPSSGVYEPTNEKRTINEIDKFFRDRDDKTVGEIVGKKEKAEFIDTWKAKWDGVPNDKYKAVAQAGNSGVPGGAFAGAGTADSQEPAGTTAGQNDLFL